MTPIFLLSLPRSGSTLLQRLLAGHPQVHTTAEPWLMLPLAEAAGYFDGRILDYQRSLAAVAIEDFAAAFPGGMAGLCDELAGSLGPHLEESVRRPELAEAGPVGALLSRLRPSAEATAAIGRAGGRIYAAHAAANRPGATVFLDKTPRYYLAADFLARTFPEARFLLLWRDPLDTLASFYSTWWGKGVPARPHAVDLMHGPALLAQAASSLGERARIVHYERLLADPQAELGRITEFLGLSDGGDLAGKLTEVQVPGRMGDPKRESHPRLRPPKFEGWRRTLDTPQRRAVAAGWLALLPEAACRTFGVDRAGLFRSLGADPSTAPLSEDGFALKQKKTVVDRLRLCLPRRFRA